MDDQFGKTIIKLNKRKVQPSANAATNEFVQEVVSINVLSLWKSKEIIAQATGSTRHGNQHITVDQSIDVKLIVSLRIEDDVFSFKPGCTNKNTKFTDLFYNGTAEIASGISINEYLQITQGNWKATRAWGFNLYKENSEIVVIAAAEREARLAKKYDNDL